MKRVSLLRRKPRKIIGIKLPLLNHNHHHYLVLRLRILLQFPEDTNKKIWILSCIIFIPHLKLNLLSRLLPQQLFLLLHHLNWSLQVLLHLSLVRRRIIRRFLLIVCLQGWLPSLLLSLLVILLPTLLLRRPSSLMVHLQVETRHPREGKQVSRELKFRGITWSCKLDNISIIRRSDNSLQHRISWIFIRKICCYKTIRNLFWKHF